MRKPRTRLGLKQKLILAFAAFIVLVSLLVSTAAMLLFSSKLTEKNDRYIDDITYQTVNSLEMAVKDLEEITFALLSSDSIQANLRALNRGGDGVHEAVLVRAIESQLDLYTLYNGAIESLSVYTDGGLEIVSRPIRISRTKTLFTRQQVYAAGGSPMWGLVNDDGKELCLARAIIDLTTQRPIGTINLVVRSEYVGSILSDITISYANGSYLLDETGLVVSSNLPDTVGTHVDIMRGAPGAYASYPMRIDGEACVVYKSKEIINGWTLATVIPENELFRESFWFLTLIALVDLAVISLTVATVWALVKRITAPFDRLAASMEEVGKGNFESRELVETNDEIGKISRSYNEMVDNLEQLIDQVYRLEISSRQAELEFLKMQINPHFLYNTLDTIGWMARQEHVEEIARMTTALAALLRANVKHDDFIPLASEMESVNNYLLIQKVRFGAKLDARVEVEEACLGCAIPNFILQPLVENAIIHGLEPKPGGGRLGIRIRGEAGRVHFTVTDDGAGIPPGRLAALQREMDSRDDRRSFIGIKNVDRRLRLYYGEAARLDVESTEGVGTTIRFSIPYAPGSPPGPT